MPREATQRPSQKRKGLSSPLRSTNRSIGVFLWQAQWQRGQQGNDGLMNEARYHVLRKLKVLWIEDTNFHWCWIIRVDKTMGCDSIKEDFSAPRISSTKGPRYLQFCHSRARETRHWRTQKTSEDRGKREVTEGKRNFVTCRYASWLDPGSTSV